MVYFFTRDHAFFDQNCDPRSHEPPKISLAKTFDLTLFSHDPDPQVTVIPIPRVKILIPK